MILYVIGNVIARKLPTDVARRMLYRLMGVFAL